MPQRLPLGSNKAANASHATTDYSRRQLLSLLAIGPLFGGVSLVSLRSNAAAQDENAGLVMRDGWILRADDLNRLA